MLQWLRNRLPTRQSPRRRPPTIRQLEVPREVLEASRRETTKYPHSETMFLWTGRCTGARCRVRALVLPEVTRSGGRVRISRKEMKRVSRQMRAREEILVLQIHTHPGAVAFSGVDEEEAADQGSGAIAMVVHHFGQTKWSIDRDVAIYERDAIGRWNAWQGTARVIP